MPSTTGPIRSSIGPMKQRLTTHQQSAKDLTDADTPTDIAPLRDHIRNLETINAKLAAATATLKSKHDEWVRAIPDDEDEHKLYTDACDEITNLFLDTDDITCQINVTLKDCRHELDLLQQPAQPAAGVLGQQAPAQAQQTGVPVATVPPPLPPGPPVPTPRVHSTAFKAPKIRLPTFDGDYMQFKQFWGIFESNIHNRTDMGNIEKFTYLVSQLEGDAKKALIGVTISDENYDVAVALLKSRFDRADDRIVTLLYSEFMSLQQSSGKFVEKQRTLDECERIFRQLQTAGQDIDSNNALVVGMLSKFPAGFVRDLQRFQSVGTSNTLSEVREGIRKALVDEETTTGVLGDLQSMNVSRDRDRDPPRSSRGPPRKSDGGGNNHFNYNSDRDGTYSGYHTSALPSLEYRRSNRGYQNPKPTTKPQYLTPPRECYFCGGGHFNGDCTAYDTAKSRVNRLTQQGRCARCLRVHKPALFPCSFFIKCVFCHNEDVHTSTLCPCQYPDKPMGTGQPPTQQPPVPPVNIAAPVYASPPNTVTTAPETSDSAASTPKSQSGGVTALNSDVKPALFQTARTTAINPATGKRIHVRLAMDTLSSRSYIREDIARQLGLATGQSEKLYVSVFGASKSVEVPTSRVEFDISFRDGNLYRMEANTTKVICQTGVIPDNWSAQERQVFSNFEGALADDPFDSNGAVDILVGANMVWDFISGPKVSTGIKSLFLIPSKFGLMLAGETQSEQDNKTPAMICLTESPCRYPSELGYVSCQTKFEVGYPDIDEFWELEKIGITDSPIENDDDKALDMFQKTITFEEGRYQAALPWIEEKRDHLPSNYDMAYDRLRSLSKRLKSKPEILQAYRDAMELQQQRGIIEDVPPSDVQTTNIVHYLPHQAVEKPTSSTTKVRIVYDAAAKKGRDSLCLNQCLLRGPVILPDLCQLLMRMRTKEIVVISDIEKAFLQIGLHPQDRDVTRFLWFKDDSKLSLTDNVVVKRFKRVNFGVICSPFLLGATLQHHLSQENSDFAESIRDNIYVDNVISGLSPEDDPVKYYNDIKGIFSRAGMNIQEFCSNSPALMSSIPEGDRVKQTDARVLGLKWDSQHDDSLRLFPSGKLNCPTKNATKRTVLQAVASVFDPLGFFQPVLLPAKCFLQKLWKLKYGWDTPLEQNLQDEWEALHILLSQLFTHRIPRFIGELCNETSIAVFCDASARAYATAVYLRCRKGNGSWLSHLIYAKSRLAPSSKPKSGESKISEKVNIPRLELLGSLIGVRAGNFCRTGLKLPNAKIDFFIDSQCVLRWIGSSAYLKRFVANRIEEIRKTTNCEFHYVASEENPSDFSTRGKLPVELFSSALWWNGPPWLSKDHSEWPKSEMPILDDKTITQIQSEIRPAHFEYTLATTEARFTKFLTIDPTSMSSFSKLAQVSAICLKFLKIKVWSKLSKKTQESKPVLSDLFGRLSDETSVSSDDYDAVKRGWVRCAQQEHFSDAILTLETGDPLRRPAQFIEQLGLQLEDGLLRAHGRYLNADLTDSARAPYLLPKNDHITTLIIEDVHSRAMHSGVAHTLSLLRQEFWVPHGRAQVRKIVKHCLLCRRYKSAPPFKLPPFPPLPRERVARSAPFQTIGLDYFGPISVKVQQTTMKMWVCLFTCLSIRAIHLEPVMDFSAQEFLHCLIRYAARRGVPQTIISDNAAQFQLVKILGDKAWPRVPSDESVTSYSASNGIKWKFITELAPWQGGFYERLVGLVKSTLRTSIRSKLLTWTDFVTLLTEAESVVNSRPLTYIGDDIESSFRVLRPCDFLLALPSAVTDSPSGGEVSAKDFGDAGKRLVSIWKQRCRTLEKLWQRWYEDYLLSLRERRKVSHKAGRSDVDKAPLLGQVVLICDSDAPRGRWRLARITDLLPGKDGKIRAAELKLSNGYQLRRALNHLVPLEVERDIQEGQSVPEEPEDQDTELPQPEPPATDGGQINHDDVSNGDDFDFFGFSQDDVQYTMDALQRFDGLQPDEVAESA